MNDCETVKKVADDFGLVYTPFHGCGYKLVPEALTRLGIKHLYCEPKQMVIDGDFPTVVSPNPENPEGFYLAIDLAKEKNVDFILGTDPDSDRVGIMVRNKAGEFEPVTGNQTGVLLLDYLIGAMKRGQAARAPRRAQDHRDDRDGARRRRGQRPRLLRHLHRLRVHGGEDERAGERGQKHRHLSYGGEPWLADRPRPRQGT